MANLNERIREQRLKKGYTLLQIAELIGVKEATVQRYESGEIKNIKHDTITKLSEILGCSPAYLMGWEDTASSEFQSPTIAEDTVIFPVIGDIAAGYDNIALENWNGDTVEVPLSYLEGRNREDFFALCVKGDSMFPEYRENDKVLILKQTSLDYSGQVGAVIYDDENATLKKVEYQNGEGWLRLVPVNPNFPIKIIDTDALERCHILGVPKYLLRRINK